MSGHNICNQLFQSGVAGDNVIADPGSAGTIDLKGKSFGILTLSAACSLTAAPAGTVLIVYNPTVGALVVDAAGDHTIGAADARILISVAESTNTWVSTADMAIGT